MAVSPLAMRIIASSILIANRAGRIIHDVMANGELGILEKVCMAFYFSEIGVTKESFSIPNFIALFFSTQAKDDLQTQADRSAQQCIIASLAKQFPNVKVIGEEGVSDIQSCPREWIISDFDNDFLTKQCPEALKNVSESDVVIWVDPLDGTSEYTQGYLEHVTVMIGLSVRNQSIGGVIHQPYFKRDANGTLGRTIWGLKGLGTSSVDQKPRSNGFVVTTTRSHSNELVQGALIALEPSEIIRVGGAGYKVLQLLEGQADAYVYASNGCKKWDTCGNIATQNRC